jgi:hypothetical protein
MFGLGQSERAGEIEPLLSFLQLRLWSQAHAARQLSANTAKALRHRILSERKNVQWLVFRRWLTFKQHTLPIAFVEEFIQC